ncbi:unnamed protein product [Didymodactylos carnosus]|uniref:EF-hand domain-containing protein n=1 Tax=Didymodactylos carnosus TaxID=1234261 RepID=A0A814IYU0_9BILA|nr:unnamed protein product [Didymodactylos carnosus]CAF1100052.1 unnamed protein product [Didymodactylos carnosus]CAF3803062.1 unnamed protein product [Didymodactylos carnosus]CAF3861511.1 unnamed protein product [Didymodactylos carnosus]
MGNRYSSRPLNGWDLNSYSQMTGLSPAAIQQLEVAFQQQAGATGRLTINQFKNIYAAIESPVASFNWDTNAERAFLMFDQDGNGVLTFEEFLMGYLLLQRNINPLQRWQYVINYMPVQQQGYLNAQEAQLLLANMQRFYNLPGDWSQYYPMVWQQVDPGNTGYVPAVGFIQAFQALPQVQQLIW